LSTSSRSRDEVTGVLWMMLLIALVRLDTDVVRLKPDTTDERGGRGGRFC
jgi:hypothetical protein